MSWRRAIGAMWIAFGAGVLGLLGMSWPAARLVSPDPSVLLQDRHGAYLGEVNIGQDGRLGFWPAGKADRVATATLAIEDRHFYDHAGVSPTGIVRALRDNLLLGERVSGASTLPMQVARLQSPGARTYGKKAVEAMTALLLVDRYGHDAVLAHYLRLAPYGNNVHGARYAAHRYFGKPVANLTWAEASLLAALPQAPGQMNPYDVHGRRRATDRARRILDNLHQQGTIDAVTRDIAVEELDRLQLGHRPRRPEAAILPVLALDGLDATDPEARTTLDLELQERLEQLALHQVLDWRDRGAEQAAIVVLDRETMEVRASVGSIGYYGTHAGSMDFTRVRRYPGSTLKPFAYAAALDRGTIASNTIVDDLRHGPEGIRNADNSFLGPLMPRVALANSRNVPAVELVERIGLAEIYDLWGALGLHDHDVDAEDFGMGLAIGGMPVRLIDLVTAYGALANDGMLRPARVLEDAEPTPGERVFRADHARLVGQWLSDPVARTPTFPRASHGELPFAAAMKTGTSPDFRDSWAVGWSEDYVVGVWVGHPDWEPMNKLSGYNGAGQIFARTLRILHADDTDGLAAGGLPAPDGWSQAMVCGHTGHLANEHCHQPRTEWFPPGGVPVETCEAHIPDEATGRVLTNLPPRYASWVQRSKLPTSSRGMATDTVGVEILSPQDGMKIIADPEVPADRSTLRLSAAVAGADSQVVWLVDGEPFAVVDWPYTARWPVKPGSHTFEARLAFRPERSAAVVVEAR